MGTLRDRLSIVFRGRRDLDFRETGAYIEADAFLTSLFAIACFISGTAILVSISLLPASINLSGNVLTHYLWAATLAIGSLLSLTGRFFSILKFQAVGNLGISIGFFVYVLAIASTGRAGSIIAGLFFFCISVGYARRSYLLNKLDRERGLRSGNSTGFRHPD